MPLSAKMLRPKSAALSSNSLNSVGPGGTVRQMTLETLGNDDEEENSLEEKSLRPSSGSQLREGLVEGGEKAKKLIPMLPSKKKMNDEGSIGSDDDGDEDDDDEDEGEGRRENDESASNLEGVYDASDYEHLDVTNETKELFEYITRFTPQAIDLEHKLKPFIPDFIPAVGDIDAFLKVVRPDSKDEDLGLSAIDEPAARQSDPTVLNLRLRALTKETTSKESVMVKTLEAAEENHREIEKWIGSIGDLHRSKPPPTVHYSRNMPSIDSLMQEWDPEFEELLKEVKLPSADLDCDLHKYTEIICNLFDIPIYKSRIQSLHVLFSLYLAFKKHQHFQHRGNNGQTETESIDDPAVTVIFHAIQPSNQLESHVADGIIQILNP